MGCGTIDGAQTYSHDQARLSLLSTARSRQTPLYYTPVPPMPPQWPDLISPLVGKAGAILVRLDASAADKRHGPAAPAAPPAAPAPPRSHTKAGAGAGILRLQQGEQQGEAEM